MKNFVVTNSLKVVMALSDAGSITPEEAAQYILVLLNSPKDEVRIEWVD